MLIHVTYPKQQLEEDQCKPLPSHVKRVVAVMHHRDHYGVMEINIKDNTVTIYDGLSHPLMNWFDHIVNGMKRCYLIPLAVTHRVSGQSFGSEPARTRHTPSAEGYEVQFDNETWRLRRGSFVQQVDGFNCGPIACMKVLELFSLVDERDVRSAYSSHRIRQVVMQHWQRFLQTCSDDLPVRVRNPQRQRHLQEIDSPPLLPIVAAAGAASAAAEEASMDICFCCADSPSMPLVRLECCKHTVHKQCLLACLSINSQCVYCRKVLDIALILMYPIITRNENLIQTPDATQRPVVRSLQDALNYVDGKTPLRDADRHREESQEKKRMGQLQQAEKMKRQYESQILSEGCGPGAVVTVLVDYRAVSHGIGIVGIVYQFSPSGGARVATQHGLISHAKGVYWIPADKYKMNARPDEDAVIPPDLQRVRDNILAGSYDENGATEKLSIVKTHQLVTQSISPCRKAKCVCAKGQCKPGRCGCIKNNFKCTSACSCNGNCTANPNNGK